jgi:hypothetical protein
MAPHPVKINENVSASPARGGHQRPIPLLRGLRIVRVHDRPGANGGHRGEALERGEAVAAKRKVALSTDLSSNQVN